MKRPHAFRYGIVLAAMVSLASPVLADTIVVPIGVTGPTPNPGPALPFSQTIDGSGLSSALTTGDVAPATAGLFPTHVIADETDGAISPELRQVAGRVFDTSLQDLVFDLGGTFDLTGLALWNYGERFNTLYFNDRGLKDFTLEFSSDGGTVFGASLALSAAMAPTGASSGLVTYGPELLSFLASGVTHVRLGSATNHGGNFTGFNEIAFISGVPEPSSLALFGLVGGIVLVRRRR